MLYKSLWVIGMRFVLLTMTLCCSLGPSPGLADIYVHYSNRTSMLFEDLPALFGSPLPKDGLTGVLVESRPLNACSPIAPPPLRNSSLTHFIVLIRRFDCNFDIKVLHAQRAGYSAAIVHNMNSDTLLRMGFSDERIALEIHIPSVFTSFSAAKILKSYIVPERGVYVILQPVFFLPIWYYLIPVSWIVGIILALLLAVLVVRCMQLRRRMRRSRMTREQLRKIPTHTFHKGDEYDICVICLDEYEEGDRLRVLPCSHAYHSQCVDPWLTRSKRTCPVCKQRVTHFTPDPSDSESDSENTPLLHPPAPSSPEPHPSAVTTTTEQCFGATSQHDTPLLPPSCPNGGTGSSSGSGSSEADSEGDGNAPLSSLDTVPLIHWHGAGM